MSIPTAFRDQDLEGARKAAAALRVLRLDPGARIISGDGRSAPLEADAVQGLLNVVQTVLDGAKTASLDEEITPQDAAEILRMSRPTVMRLVAAGKLAVRQVGAHHRLSKAEVLQFKAEHGARRRNSLDALAAFTQAFDR